MITQNLFRENLETALERGFVAIPLKTMITVLSFLLPHPDRTRASCKRDCYIMIVISYATLRVILTIIYHLFELIVSYPTACYTYSIFDFLFR